MCSKSIFAESRENSVEFKGGIIRGGKKKSTSFRWLDGSSRKRDLDCSQLSISEVKRLGNSRQAADIIESIEDAR